VEVAADSLTELITEAAAAHRRMWASAGEMDDDACRAPSLLPGWSRGHVLTHWARNADGQARMLEAAMRGEVAAQYPGGSEQRQAEIEAGATRPGRLILQDARAAVDRLEDTWRRMPPDAWGRPTGARAGQRPAWQSVWARWRETEIHHVDLGAEYTHEHWPAQFVSLMLPRVLPTLDTRLAGGLTVQVQVTDRDWPQADTLATASDEVVVVSGTASAVLCWLTGRPVPGPAGLAASRSGQDWPLPVLSPWA
jgi:maleylpyruvate isomerase